MFRKFARSAPRNVSCPAFAIGCDKCSPISILRPELVIEERRWYPYPKVIRHYIEKPKEKKVNCLKKSYRKLVEEWRQRAQRKEDEKRMLEAKERIERERCLRELRRLHSYHQTLCNRTQSFPEFSKDMNKICSTKSKIKWKSRSVSANRDQEKSTKKGCCSGFSFIRFGCNILCFMTVITIIGVTILFFV
ncbi:unnamed protein product, partial [Iphiclides podalirius]